MKFVYKIKDNESINAFLLKERYSHRLISAIKYQGGKTLVNGENKHVETILKNGDILEVHLPPEDPGEYEESPKSIEIIYEDEYLLIVLKPVHIETIPSRNNNDSIVNRVKYYYRVNGIEANIHVITRLDKETSGLVLIAKNRYIHHLFGNHVQIEKKYLALVKGIIENDVDIEAGISREKEGKMKRIVDMAGDYAKTGVKIVKIIDGNTLVECRLYTGRTHQIRVHLHHINHPVLGDRLYNDDSHEFLYLHCFSLAFLHPIKKEPVKIINYPEWIKAFS